ncbi:MAG TPA: hypothetical protein VF168_02750 [Trueperaceae bacterium]
MGERELWQFFREVRDAVAQGNRGAKEQPYRSGTFMVTARAGEVELTVKDISEEDAVLIAGELNERGVRALVNGSVLCPHCGERVPEQSFCVRCRRKLAGELQE